MKSADTTRNAIRPGVSAESERASRGAENSGTATACRQESVFALIDGELSSAEATALKRHIKTCTICRGFWNDLKPVVDAMRHMTAPKLRPYEAIALHQRIISEAPGLGEISFGSARPGRAASSQVAMPALQPTQASTVVTASQASGRPRARRASVYASLLALVAGFVLGEFLAHLPSSFFSIESSEANDPARAKSAGAAVTAVRTSSIAPGQISFVRERLLPSGTRVIWNFEQ